MKYIIFLFCLLNFGFAIAAEPIVLKHADEFIFETLEDQQVRYLVGNVEFLQGNKILKCDKATDFMDLNKIKLSGNVTIIQNTLTLKAPLIDYDGNTYIAKAFGGVTIKDKETFLKADNGDYSTKTLIADFKGNVKIEDDSVIIFADYIHHERRTRNSIASGNVMIKGKYTNVLLTGDSVVNISAEKYSKAIGNPILIQIDTVKSSKNTDSLLAKTDTLIIQADLMEAYRNPNNELYKFSGNVRMIRTDVSSKSEIGFYFKDKERIQLEQNPTVWYDSTQLHANSIDIQLPNRKLNLILARNKAIAVTQNDTLFSDKKEQISGNSISIIFVSDSLDKIVSKGDAKSLYFMKTDGKPDGMVRISADELTIDIEGKTAEKIIMVNQVPGDYLPEQMIFRKEKEYYLPSFKWKNDKPVKPKIKLRSE